MANQFDIKLDAAQAGRLFAQQDIFRDCGGRNRSTNRLFRKWGAGIMAPLCRSWISCWTTGMRRTFGMNA